MQENKWLSTKEYQNLKENAYSFAIMLEKENLLSFFEGLEFSNKEEYIIYGCTLLYPNDLQIIEEFNKKLDLNKISQKLNIPVSILKIKLNEYSHYKYQNVLKNYQPLMRLASKLSNTKLSDETNELFESRLKD